MRRFIKEAIIVLFLFLIITYVYSLVSTHILSTKIGLSTSEQIETQFKNLELQKDTINTIYLGSSRFYRAINPLEIGEFGYNFAHDNDSYNQEYYKLLYAYELLPNLKNVVIAYDYVSFSFISGTRNYVYHKYLKDDYLDDYDDNIYDICIFPLLNMSKTFGTTITALFRRDKAYDLTYKGQLQYYSGKASETDMIKRDECVLKIQENYFDKIIRFCDNHDLNCVFVNMPIRDGEYNGYSKEYIEMMESRINSKIRNNVYYLNYSREESLLSTNLFTDICHYNIDGSTVFSKTLKNDIERLNIFK